VILRDYLVFKHASINVTDVHHDLTAKGQNMLIMTTCHMLKYG